MWSGRRPGAESEPRINQQDFRAVDLSKMRSYIHVYIQGGGWRHPGGWMVAPPWRLELTGAHIYAFYTCIQCRWASGPHFWQVDGPEVLLTCRSSRSATLCRIFFEKEEVLFYYAPCSNYLCQGFFYAFSKFLEFPKPWVFE